MAASAPQDPTTKAMSAQWPAGAKITAAAWVAGASTPEVRESIVDDPALARRLALQEGLSADQVAEVLDAGFTEEHLSTIVPVLDPLWTARANDPESPRPHATRAALLRWVADLPDATTVTKNTPGDTDWEQVVAAAVTDTEIKPAGEVVGV